MSHPFVPKQRLKDGRLLSRRAAPTALRAEASRSIYAWLWLLVEVARLEQRRARAVWLVTADLLSHGTDQLLTATTSTSSSRLYRRAWNHGRFRLALAGSLSHSHPVTRTHGRRGREKKDGRHSSAGCSALSRVVNWLNFHKNHDSTFNISPCRCNFQICCDHCFKSPAIACYGLLR